MTQIAHAPGRPYEVRGHRLWVETEGAVFALIREFTGQ